MSARRGGISFWFEEIGRPEPVDVLDGDVAADVAVVGAGYTGLWAAYYLRRARPDLDVRVIEQRFAGYGASGRNGGWLTNSITGGHDGYAREFGRAATAAFQVALNDTVDEVIAVAEREGIDAEIRKGGSLLVARNRAQEARLEALADHAAAWPEEGWTRLTKDETDARIRVAGALGGLWQPHCARLQPARLARGLADAVRAHGARVHEGTTALSIGPGEVRTDRGTVRAPYVLRATEGFTARLSGLRRTWVPMNSSVVITEPLPASAWEDIGWAASETLEDLAHVYAYAQRTPDGRIALGGRGNPYRFASATDLDGDIAPATVASLTTILEDWFPALRGVGIAHAWSGVLGVPRNWRATVGLDRTTGVGWAGGYVGTGVAATNLAGRTLADLVLGEDTPITRLPWVDQRTRRWEPEPLRWLGIQGLYAAYRWADRQEAGGRTTTAPVARLADAVSGRAY